MREHVEQRHGSLSAPVNVATVLLVDDDPAALRLLRRVFELSGWRVIEATNGREALAEYYTNEQIDLIVSDIQMPEMDGLAMCRWLDVNDAAAPVIFITGSNIGPEEIRTAGISFAAFFAKPFSVLELMQEAVATLGS